MKIPEKKQFCDKVRVTNCYILAEVDEVITTRLHHGWILHPRNKYKYESKLSINLTFLIFLTLYPPRKAFVSSKIVVLSDLPEIK
jgi:hypothetical protein